MDGIATFANDRVAAHQVDRDGKTGDGELLESPVVQVLAQHRVELPAAILVQEVPVAALRQAAKNPGGAKVRGERICVVVGIQAGGVQNAGHGAGARAGDHVDDDAATLEGLEDAEVRHASGGPAAEGHAHAHAAEVVYQPLQPVGHRPAQGQFWRRFVDLEIAGGEIGEVRHGGDHGTVVLDHPGDTDLVAPAPGRHVDRLQAADGGVCRIGRDEIDGAVDELHEPRRSFRRQVGMDVENDSIGVLPASDLLPYFL